MAQQSFYQVFVNLLKDLFDAENQITEALPLMAQTASHPELKQAVNEHLQETKHQVQRLKTIFKHLNENPTGVRCAGMKGLIAEAQEHISKDRSSPSSTDVCLIIDAQKVEHYEIAGYGSARALALQLRDAGVNERVDFDEIADLLQQTLDEESAADEKLTDIAEGGFFTQGINDEASQELGESQEAAQFGRQTRTRRSKEKTE